MWQVAVATRHPTGGLLFLCWLLIKYHHIEHVPLLC